MINRLSKWSAARQINLGLSFGEKPELIQSIKDNVAARLELDINTHQSNSEIFSKDKLVLLLQELSDISNQISTDGIR